VRALPKPDDEPECWSAGLTLIQSVAVSHLFDRCAPDTEQVGATVTTAAGYTRLVTSVLVFIGHGPR
jgi:hypothetical protein